MIFQKLGSFCSQLSIYDAVQLRNKLFTYECWTTPIESKLSDTNVSPGTMAPVNADDFSDSTMSEVDSDKGKYRVYCITGILQQLYLDFVFTIADFLSVAEQNTWIDETMGHLQIIFNGLNIADG